MAGQSAIAEPWEHAVQAVLRVLCQRAAGQDPEPDIATMTATVCALARSQDPATAVARTRIGLTALDLASDNDTTQARTFRTALITTGNADAYAARDLLASLQMSKSLTSAHRTELQALVRACGLGAGTIPGHLHHQLTSTVGRAEATLPRAMKHVAEEPALPRSSLTPSSG